MLLSDLPLFADDVQVVALSPVGLALFVFALESVRVYFPSDEDEAIIDEALAELIKP